MLICIAIMTILCYSTCCARAQFSTTTACHTDSSLFIADLNSFTLLTNTNIFLTIASSKAWKYEWKYHTLGVRILTWHVTHHM